MVDPWNCWGAAQVFAYASELRRRLVASAVSRVLVTGGAGTIGAAVVRRLLADPAYEVRVSDQRPAPAVDARGLRGAHRRPARARAGARGDEGLHARDPPRGDRRRDRQLPPAAAHADRGQQRAVQRRHPRGARPRGRALRVRVLLDGVRARRAVPDARGPPARLPGADLGVRLLQAHRRGVLPRGPRRARASRTRSAARSTPTARASCPTPSPGSRTRCPT